jgi:hypothetical protein
MINAGCVLMAVSARLMVVCMDTELWFILRAEKDVRQQS